MKLIDLKEEYKAPSDIQEYIDQWIEAGLDSPELDQYVEHAPSLKHNKTVWRVLFGHRAIDTWGKYKKGHHVKFDNTASTSETFEGLKEGVIGPNEGGEEFIVLEIHLRAGKSYGRSIWHSDKNHPENVQDEFLLKKGLTFTVQDIREMDSKVNTDVYVLA